jgi:hypothetical protein
VATSDRSSGSGGADVDQSGAAAAGGGSYIKGRGISGVCLLVVRMRILCASGTTHKLLLMFFKHSSNGDMWT